MNSSNASNGGEAGALAAAGISIVFVIAFYVVVIGFAIWIHCRIAAKAGYPAAYGLLAMIPCVNFVVMIMFIFQEWPIQKENRELREALARIGGTPGVNPPPPTGAVPPPY